MKINQYQSNTCIIKEIGNRVRKSRIEQMKTQENICELCGVSLATIKGIENGKGCSLDTFIKILKALNLCENLNDLIPVFEGITPVELAKLGKERQRVYHTKKTTGFKWGDEK